MNMRTIHCSRLLARLAFTLLIVVAISGIVHAQSWPARGIRMISPYPAGGSTDRIARVLSEHLAVELGVPVTVENHVGGAATIGSLLAARANPDGYTLLLSGLASHVVAPLVSPNSYDPINDFTHIAFIGGTPTALVTADDSLKSIDDVVHRARTKGPLTYASVGVGSLGNLVAEAVAYDKGITLTHIPYSTLNVGDVMERRVDLGSFAWSTVQGLVTSGKFRMLGVSADTRLANAPDVATLKEQGLDLSVYAWLSLSGPPKLPPAMVDRLNAIVVKFMQSATARERLAQDVFDKRPMTPVQFRDFMQSEISFWRPRVTAVLKRG